jgi:hypothetical protein
LPPKIAEELRRDYRDGYNIGFRTGDWSKLDGWPVAVLDADIRSDDPARRSAMMGFGSGSGPQLPGGR